jgi:photosystem II stability/assembly factor-like uncharacterized protein
MQKFISFKCFLIIAVTTFAGHPSLHAQWTQMDGPYGKANVRVAFTHGSQYYASTDQCGFFSKPATQAAWHLNSNIYFDAYAISGDSLFASAHYFSGGMSREMGIQLFDLTNPEVAPTAVKDITALALTQLGGSLLGGNEYYGVFKMKPDGSEFGFYNNSLPVDTISTPWGTHYEIYIGALAVMSDYVFAGTKKGVYRTDNALSDWTAMNAGLEPGKVNFLEVVQDTLYAAIGTKVYKSTNKGENWALVLSASSRATSLQQTANQVFVTTSEDGILYSNDFGVSWSDMNTGLDDLSINFVASFEDVLLCGTSVRGIYKYQDSSWADDNHGMVCSKIDAVVATDSELICNDRMNIYKSSGNNGWEAINIPEIVVYPNLGHGIVSLKTQGERLFSSYGYSQPQWPYFHTFISYTTDYGLSWSDLYTTFDYETDNPYKLYINGNTIYRYQHEKIFFTTDMGSSWVEMSIPPIYCNNIDDFLVYNNTPFAATCSGGEVLRFSETNGWELANNGLPTDYWPEQLAWCDSALFVYIVEHGMYVSFENGDNWSNAGNGFNTDFGFNGFANQGRHLFVSTENGVYVTSDFGQNWVNCSNGLKNPVTSSVLIVQDTLYAGTYGNGVWKRAISDVHLAVDENAGTTTSINLFPNPANDFIMIDASKHNFNTIEIIDLAGRKLLIQTLQSNRIDIRHLPEGIYIVLLKSKNEIHRSKIVIKR